MSGKTVYELYCKCFNRLWPPKWEELNQSDQEDWDKFALNLTHEVIDFF